MCEVQKSVTTFQRKIIDPVTLTEQRRHLMAKSVCDSQTSFSVGKNHHLKHEMLMYKSILNKERFKNPIQEDKSIQQTLSGH